MSCVTVRVQADTFDATHETALLLRRRDDVGGVGAFTGIVRGGGGLVALELEHYPGMTESMMRQIAESACTRFGLTGCTVIHRVGRLEVGMPIVLVLCAAAHRKAALEGTEFMMDWLKTSAPFWKREEFSNGRSEWVQPRAQDDAATARWGTLGT
ncbi:molybdenum cofactor biosynthesis protein MoaE [Komagataeibacter intermedius]|uniref:Molybdopterin synthase catalytic subunit n=2 Tax=Komagataeibacter intermedius TaxID=66229 RepID=A0A0N1N6C3_9PROT|nr:molybdenum cofactor biosynthesis protein MoaE [Komagataeibacter intermedius]KPH86487.1 molybdenum cofactor biosynthesis protein MoaE [Komagataeibacter intermedius AF2]MCF3636053.1 molybdenum cofactor biosynthesis protein MoaE [Komagataeibacter intermedius]GAN85621.1 molybdopterin converting factor large subunit MoeE [Komagataeibacter intermedius TF2]GBQ70533.1 molybdopterin converting factor large subunit MoeE [Komagataeibacter intermedius NRIC 0521]